MRRLWDILRPFSPYRASRRADGTFLLPDFALLAPTSDTIAPHGRFWTPWIPIGAVPRVVFSLQWTLYAALITTGLHFLRPTLGLSAIVLATQLVLLAYTVLHWLAIPSYHFDPIAYADVQACGLPGSYAVASAVMTHSLGDWRIYAIAVVGWLWWYPWATPSSDR